MRVVKITYRILSRICLFYFMLVTGVQGMFQWQGLIRELNMGVWWFLFLVSLCVCCEYLGKEIVGHEN